MSDARVRRPRQLFLRLGETPAVPVEALLGGEVRVAEETALLASLPLSGLEEPVSPEEAGILYRVPADRWTAIGELAAELEVPAGSFVDLADRGLLLREGAGAEAEIDRRLAEVAWSPHAAHYHFVARGEQEEDPVDFELEAAIAASEATFSRFIELYGKPPPAAPSRGDAEARVELPTLTPSGQLYEVLERRRTTRLFDPERSLPLGSLALLLQSVFGARTCFRPAPEVELIRRTSPSGGCLHPIEAYPVILDVADLPSGLYHYHATGHTLERLCQMPVSELRAMVGRWALGQRFVATAHALVILVARFHRSFWKYRGSARTLSVTLLDAGHLSQTFYLVATERKLGAFLTPFIDAPAIEAALSLDPAQQGVLGLCGCGLPDPHHEEPRFEEHPIPTPPRV